MGTKVSMELFEYEVYWIALESPEAPLSDDPMGDFTPDVGRSWLIRMN